jgi:hypothetical protein
MNAGTCTLELAVGRTQDCPGHRCPLWEAEQGTGCVVDPIRSQIINTPGLAQLLLELRATLTRAQRISEHEASREFLYLGLHAG